MNVNPSSVGPAASFSQSLDPLRRPPAGDGGNGTRPVSPGDTAKAVESPGDTAKAVEASGQTQRHQQDAAPRDAAPPAPPPSGTPSRDIPRGGFVDISA